METELLLSKRNPILWHLKSAYIPGWLEDRQSVAAQIIVYKKKERRLRKEKLIWTVNETYFILFKYADWFMLKKKNRSGFREGAPTGRETAVWMWNPSSRGKKPNIAMPNIFIMVTASVWSYCQPHRRDAEQGPLSFPSSGESGTMAVFQTCSELIYSFPLLFFLNLKLQRLLKYNKMHRRATRVTNSTHRCTRNQCTLVKVPSQSADLSPAKWRAPSCEVDSFALVTWQTDSRVVSPRSYLLVFMPLSNRFPPLQAGQAIWFL